MDTSNGGWARRCRAYADYFYRRSSQWSRLYWSTTFITGIIVAASGFVSIKVTDEAAQLAAGCVTVLMGFVIPFLGKVDASSRAKQDQIAGDNYLKLSNDFLADSVDDADAESDTRRSLRATFNSYLMEYDDPPPSVLAANNANINV
jgi:hypothetical protein